MTLQLTDIPADIPAEVTRSIEGADEPLIIGNGELIRHHFADGVDAWCCEALRQSDQSLALVQIWAVNGAAPMQLRHELRYLPGHDFGGDGMHPCSERVFNAARGELVATAATNCPRCKTNTAVR